MCLTSKIENRFVVQVAHSINGESIILAIFDTRAEAHKYREQVCDLLEKIDSEYDLCRESGKSWSQWVEERMLPREYLYRINWAAPQVKQIHNVKL